MDLNEIKKGILSILADGEFHSGTALADKLGISRSAIWKHLNALEGFGIEISAISGKGYRLSTPLELLNRNTMMEQLSIPAQNKVKELIIHDLIDSTNTYLMNRAQQTQQSGIVCLAEYQGEGRGRRGRQWISPFGSNVYLSLLWRYQCGPALLSALSLVAGIAVVRALRQFGFEDIGLKWPNDIYWREKKLGGILVEISGETDGPCSVVIGLGVNRYIPELSAAEIDRPWVDLNTIVAGGQIPPRNDLIAEIINQLIKLVDQFDTVGIGPYLEEWRGMDCMLGKDVFLELGDHKIAGTVAGIDDQGLLKLQLRDGSIHTYASGEVTFNLKG